MRAFSSNYVLSQPTQSNPQVVAAADSTRDANIRFSRVLPTIRSVGLNSLTASDIPSDASLNPSLGDNETSAVDMTNQMENRPMVTFKLNALCVQALLYPITMVIYLLIGAAIFTAIEHEREIEAKDNAEEEIRMVISKVASKYNLSENVSESILHDFTNLCTENHLQIINATSRWTFLPSLYFAATVITAIGEMLH